ncbi:MAG: peptide-methionine (S)-S-oxide reductase MsrA [Chitinophagales bacterium]|nr:peptide-methionine (S)-S-oxide reductase MsrA [Chitinophagales bacterium]
MEKIVLFLFIGIISWGCANSQNTNKSEVIPKKTKQEWPAEVVKIEKINQPYEGLSNAVFAGGCFWCVEAVFERVRGVEEAISGYAGGSTPNPTYKKVSYGNSDHAEAVIVYYDPAKVNYEELLTAFFSGHDPTQLNRQGPDVGRQYRSGIYYNNKEQKEAAEAFIKKLDESGKFSKPIVTEVEPLGNFYVAEGYHQEYYELHPTQPYVASVSRPKVEKFIKAHPELLKDDYK